MNTENWGDDERRAPAIEDGDVLLYSECGRIIKANTYGHGSNGIDYRSHYFRVVKGSNGFGCFLLVKHGGGQERIKIDYSAQRAAQFFEPLDSNARYLLMHMLHSLHREAQKATAEETARRYQAAFVAGTLKKRKQRGSDVVKVWIDRPITNEVSA
jgi:hypothetical protein